MITHKPEDMPSGTVELVGTTIALGYPDHNYAKVVQEMMGLTPSQVDQLLSSARGQGFMKTSDDPRPLFLTVLPERGALVRDALRDRMALLGLAEEPAPIETPAPEKAGAAASVTVETPKRAAPVMEARAETPTEPKVVAAAPTAPIEIVAEPAREEASPREAFAEALTQTSVARVVERPEAPVAAPVEEVESRFKPEPAAPLEQRPVIRVRIVARPTAPARLSSASTVTIQPRYRPMVRGGGSA
jgi:hypothetical protein